MALRPTSTTSASPAAYRTIYVSSAVVIMYDHLTTMPACSRTTLLYCTNIFLSDCKSTRLNSSYYQILYAVFCLRLDFRSVLFFFFFNDTAPTEIYPLSLHDALPI